MRRNFDEAARLLRELEPALASAGPLPRASHALESGRVLVSTAHPAGSITPDARFAAHDLPLKAIEQASIAADDDGAPVADVASEASA